MSFDGKWNVVTKTPIGDLESTLELTADGASLTGQQTAGDESSPLYDGRIEGDEASWKVDLKKPFPMTVEATATVDGDTVTGTGVAGSFPPAPFTGTRVS